MSDYPATAAEALEAILVEAEKFAANYRAELEAQPGKRVRVTRVLVYEGDSAWMTNQLAASLNVGQRQVGNGNTITVLQGKVEVIEPEGDGDV